MFFISSRNIRSNKLVRNEMSWWLRSSRLSNPAKRIAFNCSTVSSSQKLDWDVALSRAEKLLDHPTSFLNFKGFLNNQTDDLEYYLEHFISTDHPLMHSVRGLLHDKQQKWGVIVLLVSRAVGRHPSQTEHADTVQQRQVMLAEGTDMLHTSIILHESIKNLHDADSSDKRLTRGNKLALLAGDYLACSGWAKLAATREPRVYGRMMGAYRDRVLAEFVGPRDEQCQPLPPRPTLAAEAVWTRRCVLDAGDFFGISCASTLLLAGHPSGTRARAYQFGKHLLLGWRAAADLQVFDEPAGQPFHLINAPLLYELQDQPRLYRHLEKGTSCVTEIDYRLLWECVRHGRGLDSTARLRDRHLQAALDILREFPETDAHTALRDIVAAI